LFLTTKEADVELSGVMIGSENPARLTEYYSKIFGEPAMAEDGFAGWKLGAAWVTVMAHDKVKGQNSQPGRVIWNLGSSDVPAEFERFKSAGATVVLGPYHPEQEPSMWVATFEDPDGNYFQLMSPDPQATS
jgi:predicted enzyme related to lactoylglutathione lyase